MGYESIAIDSEAMRARGIIIVLAKSNELVKKILRLNTFRKLKLDIIEVSFTYYMLCDWLI